MYIWERCIDMSVCMHQYWMANHLQIPRSARAIRAGSNEVPAETLISLKPKIQHVTFVLLGHAERRGQTRGRGIHAQMSLELMCIPVGPWDGWCWGKEPAMGPSFAGY